MEEEKSAEALVLVTEWQEYRRPDFERLKKLLRAPALLDGRNVWNGPELRAQGFWYTGIGRP